LFFTTSSRPCRLPPFPTRRSSDLMVISNRHRIIRRGRPYQDGPTEQGHLFIAVNTDIARQFEFIQQTWHMSPAFNALYTAKDPLDRKSTRLNSSHVAISYAVFCLK